MQFQTVEFRVINDADQEFLYHLYASTRAEEMAQVDWTDDEREAFLRGQYKAQKASYEMTFLNAVHRIIHVGDTDAGRMIVDRQDDCLRLIDLSLMPFWRRRGIGTGILQSLMQEADGGKVPMRLHVLTESPALKLYVRMGFKRIAARNQRYEMEWRPPSLAVAG